MFLHIFGHINAQQCSLIVKQKFCQSFAQFGFADAGRPQKQKRTYRLAGIADAGA